VTIADTATTDVYVFHRVEVLNANSNTNLVKRKGKGGSVVADDGRKETVIYHHTLHSHHPGAIN